MAAKTIIAWTDHTWNLAWGCIKISPGCAHCYAETLSNRYGHHVWGAGSHRRVFGEKHWAEPIKWNHMAKNEKNRHKVFCSSMCDNFEDHPTITSERAKLWPLIRATPLLDWQLLTKRADRIKDHLPADWADGYPNVWLGVSIENSEYKWRADHLREIPAAVRFISYEPALGSLESLNLRGIDWVIYGGESGPKFRQHDLTWPREMMAKCFKENVAFFFKQSAAIRTEMGTQLDGVTVREYPTPRQTWLSTQTYHENLLFAKES